MSGIVLDAETGEPLPYANVVIDSLGSGTMSLDDGKFYFRLLQPGRYRLIVSYMGYATYTEDGVLIAPGRLTSRTIRLNKTVIQGETITVTASRKEQTTKMAPASVMIMTDEDMASRQVTTFDQALESVPGVNAFRSVPISVQSMQIRGSSDVAGGGVGNRVLLLVDGRPAITADTGGAFWSLVPTHFVDRVEVVKGAYSSLYGSTAMGGVVNVITRRPGYKAAAQLDFKVGFFEQPDEEIRYSDEAALQSEVQASYSGASENVSYLFSASRKQSDGHAENTAYEFYDLYSKLLFDLRENRNLELTIGGGFADNDYPHAWLNSARPLDVRAKYTDDRQEKRYFNGDLLYWAVPTSRLKYSARLFYHRDQRVSYFNDGDPELEIVGNEPYGTQTEIAADQIGGIAQFDYYFSDGHYFVAGTDVHVDHVDSSPDSIMYGNQRIHNAAVFAQDELRFFESFTVTVGVRQDWNHLVGGKTFTQFSPKIAAVWSPVEQLAFRGLAGQAFRAPTIGELFLQRELGGGIDFVPNPDLQPERMTVSAEVGLRFTPARIFNLDLAAFHYEYEDMIYWEEISDELGVQGPIFQVRNLNRALMQGAEVTLQSVLSDHLSASVNYTYLDAQDRSFGRENDVLEYRPKHAFNFGADGHLWRFFAHWDLRYRSEIEEVFLFPLQKPDAFWVHNANLRFAMSPHVMLSVRVNNVFNTEYEELARYRMPGRNWMFGVSFRY